MTHPRRWWWRAAVMVLAIGVLALARQGGQPLASSVTGSAALPATGPCPIGDTIPIVPSPHISWNDGDNAAYNSLPPSSGPHFSFTVATGIYTDPVPHGLTVHAMEHGHVVVQYALDTPRRVVQALEAMANRRSDRVVLAPYANLSHGIAVTAWGCLLIVEEPADRVEDFIIATAGRYEHGWRNGP